MPAENFFTTTAAGLTWQRNHLTYRIEPWGRDGLRVRATPLAAIQELPGALLPAPPSPQPQIQVAGDMAVVANGKIRLQMSAEGVLAFYHAQSGAELLAMPPQLFHSPPNPRFTPRASQSFQLTARFNAYPDERLYGLGQHQHGLLDQKGAVIELEERNTSVCIPFLLSSRGYGFLWNNPAVGRVELAANQTRWIAESTPQMDYYICAGDSPQEILARYAEVTGHPSPFPDWAAGFWQCKLRYRTQEELLSVAREYKRRGLPLSVIVVDFFHWPMMGEWKFDPEFWPDPAAMVKELDAMGVKVMVSVWPTVNLNSSNYQEMLQKGLLVRTEQGIHGHMYLGDTYPPGPNPITYYDSTHPDARRFIWEKVKQNYYDIGVKVWWLDACEPEIYPMDPQNLRFHLGNGLEVGHLYPLMHARAFYDGMTAAGEAAPISLCRSAWAGSQRYGAAVWSGDIPSTFEYLRKQLPAGLNIALSGIPWWTTDIGGFMGGDITSPYFRELIVRWFQYGVFCPLFRLHGVRLPNSDYLTGAGSGADNEVWSFGETAYAIISHLLFLRERLKPYILAQMQTASRTGLAPMRPLFVDFPQDANCWQVEDQFMFGPDLLVAPVLYEGHTSREVYLPPGDWLDAWDGQEIHGGQRLTAPAPLERVPVYWRKASPYYFRFSDVRAA